MKTLIKIVASFLIVELPIWMLMSNMWVHLSIESLSFDDLKEIPWKKVGVVLGTSKGSEQFPNYYFKYRIDAAADLYHHNKIDLILATGDNSSRNYNEPQDMKDALIELGVPDSVIFLDYAGFRTFDSMYRAKAIFGQCSFTIISQKFHNERALFIAKQLGINAIAYNARNIGGNSNRWMQFREFIARFAAVGDLYIWFKKPHFLGEKEKMSH